MTVKAESETAAALRAASVDPVYFAREILGVELNPAQKRWFAQIVPVDGWKWPRKLGIFWSGNQAGKTLSTAVLILWGAIYKIGSDTSDKKSWAERPYLWIHLAPKQNQAYHALKDIQLLIKGAHPAQKLKVRLPAGLVRETKVETYYNGLETASGSVVQFRTTEDKAVAILGYRANAISFDEAAFEPYLTSVIDEVIKMRLIASGGPLFLISTPNGMNEFYDWKDSIQSNGTMVDDRVWIRQSDNAVLVSAWVSDNIGYGISQEEYDNTAAGLENSATKDQQLKGAFLNPPDAFFTPSDVILRAFPTGIQELPKEVSPVPGHRYIAFWDPSVASDPTAVVVLDVTEKPWRGVYFKHWPTPMDVTELIGEIQKVHLLYGSARFRDVRSSCTTAYDATSLGGVIIGQLLQSVYPRKPLNFGGPDKKLKVLTNARAALAKQAVLLPASWTRLRNEVVNYKLKDQKIQQDACMALVGAIFCGEGVGDGNPSRQFNPHGRVTPRTIWR